MTGGGTRVIVVLGYSEAEHHGLHPVCAQRLAHAAAVSTADDVVVLSGWSRHPGTPSEAELMAAAWTGTARELVVDPDATTTIENARNAIDDVVRCDADVVLVVTSRWHARRAVVIFRRQLCDTGAAIVAASPPGGRLIDWLREIPRWLALPLQLTFGWPSPRQRPTSPAAAAPDGQRPPRNDLDTKS